MGGVAAALSVVIIMGRRYDQAPMAFTITRLVETFIGISCAVLADLVFQPGARPSVQAREQLARCIAATIEEGAAGAGPPEEVRRGGRQRAHLPVAAAVPGGLLRQDPGQPRQDGAAAAALSPGTPAPAGGRGR